MPEKILRIAALAMVIGAVPACGGSSNGGNGGGNVDSNAFCDGVAITAPANSPYVLPWSPGASYSMFQGNCSNLGGHRGTFAYDFDMNMGDPIYASRAGTVIFVNDQYSDDDHVEGHENNVFVEHADSTVIRYTHLMQGGALAVDGQQVVAGDLLGLAGNSGNSAGPHLHLQAFRDRSSYAKDNSIPLTFSNVIGRTETSGELIEGVIYTADVYP